MWTRWPKCSGSGSKSAPQATALPGLIWPTVIWDQSHRLQPQAVSCRDLSLPVPSLPLQSDASTYRLPLPMAWEGFLSQGDHVRGFLVVTEGSLRSKVHLCVCCICCPDGLSILVTSNLLVPQAFLPVLWLHVTLFTRVCLYVSRSFY